MSVRLREIKSQLDAFLDEHLPPDVTVKQVIFEGVQALLVTITVGAFLTSPRID